MHKFGHRQKEAVAVDVSQKGGVEHQKDKRSDKRGEEKPLVLKEKLDILKGIGISPKTAVMVGGPSKNPMYLELIEKICGIKVSVRHGVNAGAVGAAMLAGIGAGIYKDEADANRICNERR